MKLERNMMVRCQWCSKKSTLGDWNDLTYSKCVNREMKRLFKPLTEISEWGNKSQSFYMCPNCNMWSKGPQLKIVDTDDPKLLALGGKMQGMKLHKK